MEDQLTIVLLVLLILFIIYMFIQNSDVCSIVHRNEREEFNVGVNWAGDAWGYTKKGIMSLQDTVENNKVATIGTLAALGTGILTGATYMGRKDSPTTARPPAAAATAPRTGADRVGIAGNSIEQCYAYCDKVEDSKPVKRYPPSADHKQCYELCAAFHLDP
jgi:hypothetical protein